MKKQVLSWMVVMCVSQIYTESQESRLSRLSHKIKSKALEAKDSTKAFTFATIAYCQEALHKVREPNSVIIEKAESAIVSLHDMIAKVSLGVHTEQELLQNIQLLGFDKHNATKAIDLAKETYFSLLAFEKRYNGILTPWNRSKKMNSIALQVLREIKNAEMYKVYFQSHEACLQAWVINEKYREVLTSYESGDAAAVHGLHAIYQSEFRYPLLYAVEQIAKDIIAIKHFVKNTEHAKMYASVYEMSKVIVLQLELFQAAVKNSGEYKKQVAQQMSDAQKG